MAKIFYPEESILVEASKPHPPNTQYKVSLGVEDWGDNFVPVIKVQMIYDGIVSGRRSPSFPTGTDDLYRVNQASEQLLKRSKG
jgi:hypothetical protein